MRSGSRRNRRPWLLAAALLVAMPAVTVPSFGQRGRQQAGRQGGRQGGRMPRPAQPRLPNRKQPNQPSEPALMRMRLEGAVVDAQIRATGLQDVLEELAAWTGIQFEIDSEENPAISVELEKVPVSETIRRLTGRNNTVAYYDRDDAGQPGIRLVRILSSSQRPTPPRLRLIGTGSVTKHSDDVIEGPEQALSVLASSDNAAARLRATEILEASHSEIAVEGLKVTLMDPAPEVRLAAIEGLASLAAHDALPLILVCLKDPQASVRQGAVIAVGLLGDASNVTDLKRMVSDPDAAVAAAADMAIRKLSIR